MPARLVQSDDTVLLRNISWRTYEDLLYDGVRCEILVLDGEQYRPSEKSVAFRLLTAHTISDFIESSKSSKRGAWLRAIRRVGASEPATMRFITARASSRCGFTLSLISS
jgi:hypothetical protein